MSFSRVKIKCLIYLGDETLFLCCKRLRDNEERRMCSCFQDEKLRKLVEQHGTDSWKSVAGHFPVCIWFNLPSLVLTAAHGVGRGDRKVRV